MPQTCFPPEQLAAYAAGRLADDLADEISHHVGSCSDCEAALERAAVQSFDADDFLQGLKLAGRTTQRPDEPEVRRAVDRARSLDWTRASATDQDTHVSHADEEAVPGRLREYELLEKLGHGGMGAVYKARHTRLDRIVAVKLLASHRIDCAKALSRFNHEMKAAGLVDHSHIVGALDAGEVDGRPFLVMEYVEGETLGEMVGRRGPLPPQEAVELIRQAAVGLQHIHEAGLVHRDIKPSNLIVDCGSRIADLETRKAGRDDQSAIRNRKSAIVKILDLGLALLPDEDVPSELTAADQVMGSYDYIAPEQAMSSHGVDIRADIYALGCTLYFLLAGRPPFPDEKVTGKLVKHQLDQPTPLDEIRRDVPVELVAIVGKMMAKRPEDRFPTPAAVAEALTSFNRGRAHDEVGSGPREYGRRPTRGPLALRLNDARRASNPPRRRTLALVAAAFVAFAFGVVLLRLQTPTGQVVVELGEGVRAEDVRIEVAGDGGLHIADADKGWTIDVREGEYKARLTGGRDQFELDRTSVRVRRGDELRLRVSLKDSGPDGMSLDRRVAHWVFEQGGKVGIVTDGDPGYIRDPADLPAGPFELKNVYLITNGSERFRNEDVARLGGLEQLWGLKLGRYGGNSALSDGVLKHLADARLPSLEQVNLSGLPKSPEGLRHLATMHQVEQLHLYYSEIADEDLSCLADMPNLHQLGFVHVQIDGSGLHELSKTRLEQLSFVDVPLDEQAFMSLPQWPTLEMIGVSGTPLTDRGLRSMARYRRLTWIRAKSMEKVTEKGWNVLDQLPYLERLWLGDNPNSVTDAVVRRIAGSPRLEELYIPNTAVTDAGLRHLHEAKSLHELRIHDNERLSREAVAELQRALPNCEILSDFPEDEISRSTEE